MKREMTIQSPETGIVHRMMNAGTVSTTAAGCMRSWTVCQLIVGPGVRAHGHLHLVRRSNVVTYLMRVWRHRDGVVHLVELFGNDDGGDTFAPACVRRRKSLETYRVVGSTYFEPPATPITCLWCAVDPRRPDG